MWTIVTIVVVLTINLPWIATFRTPSMRFIAEKRISIARYSAPPIVPYFFSSRDRNHMWMDIYSALGRKNRILYITRYIDDNYANMLISSLLYLQSDSDEDMITLFVGSPGGDMNAGLAIVDTIRQLQCPIKTVNIGLSASIGAMICALGTPSLRYSLPNSNFLLSYVGNDEGFQGNSEDIRIFAKKNKADNQKLLQIFSDSTGQSMEQLSQYFQRDSYLNASEAVIFGVVDGVIEPTEEVKKRYARDDSSKDGACISFGHFGESNPVGYPSSKHLYYEGYDELLNPHEGYREMRRTQEILQQKMKNQVASTQTPPSWTSNSAVKKESSHSRHPHNNRKDSPEEDLSDFEMKDSSEEEEEEEEEEFEPSNRGKRKPKAPSTTRGRSNIGNSRFSDARCRPPKIEDDDEDEEEDLFGGKGSSLEVNPSSMVFDDLLTPESLVKTKSKELADCF